MWIEDDETAKSNSLRFSVALVSSVFRVSEFDSKYIDKT